MHSAPNISTAIATCWRRVDRREDDEFWRVSGIRDNNGGARPRGSRCRAAAHRICGCGESCANAQAVAEHLQGHPGVEAVLYPGLGNDPGHAVAKRQMSGGFGGMLSVRIKGGREGALKAAGRLQLGNAPRPRRREPGGASRQREPPDSPVPKDLLGLRASRTRATLPPISTMRWGCI
jgi:cystathionine gamma-synthase